MKSEERVIKIFIEDGSLEKTLKKDEELLVKIAKQQKNLSEESKQWQALEAKRLKAVERMAQTQSQLDQKLGLSLSQLKAKARQLVAELDNMPNELRKTSEQAKNLKIVYQEIARIDAESKKAGLHMKEMRGSFEKLGDSMRNQFGAATALIASLAGITLGYREMVEAFEEFEDRAANLSAITGLEGTNLDWLKDTAKQTSVATLDMEGNSIRIKQSAADIIDAYTVMGSQRAELLKNKDALHSVTQDAIILSEAMKSSLEPAVKGVSTIMNQFNEGASQSPRIINAVAAGAQAGSAEVPYLSAALEKTGTSMSMMGVSLEQGIALVEAVAPKFAEATTAGNSLDKVLLKMKEKGIGFKDGVFDMNRAIDDLQNRFAHGQSAADLFGVEHAKMAEVLVMVQGDFQRLTKEVTGTNAAYEQASKNTDTHRARQAQAKNEYTLTAIELGEKLAPAITYSTETLTGMLRLLIQAPQILRDNQEVIIALVGAFVAWQAQKIKGIALQGIEILQMKTGITLRIKEAVILQALIVKEAYMNAVRTAAAAGQNRLTAAMAGTRAAMLAMMGPLGWIIAAITGIIVAIKLYDKYNSESIRIEKEKLLAQADATAANELLKSSYDKLHKSVAALNLLGEEEKKQLKEKIALKVQEAEAQLLLAKEKQKTIATENAKVGVWDMISNSVMSGGDVVSTAKKNAKDATKNAKEAAGEMNDEIEALQETVDKFKADLGSVNEVLNAELTGDGIGTTTIAMLEEKLAKYNLALKNAKIGSEEYLRLQKKIDQTEEAMKKKRPAPAADKKDVDNARKAYESILEANQKFLEDLQVQNLEGIQKELAQETQKFEEKRKAIKDFLKDQGKFLSGPEKKKLHAVEKQLEEQQVAALERIRVKHEEDLAAKILQHRLNLQRQMMASQDLEKAEIADKYKEVEELAKGNQARLLEIQELKNQELAAVDKKYADKQEEIRKSLADRGLSDKERELKAIDDHYKDLIVQADGNEETIAQIKMAWIDEVADYEKMKRRELLDFALDQAGAIESAAFEIAEERRKNETDSELNALNERKDGKFAELDAAKEKELSNKALTEDQKKAIQDRYDAQKDAADRAFREEEKRIKLEAWEADKKANLGQAIIAGALAVVKALPNPLLATAATIAAGLQITKIATQKPPQFGKGGRFGGIAKGPSHANGGIHMINSQNGEKVGEMEGNEPYLILSGKTYQNNSTIIDGLLYNSVYRNGARLDYPTFSRQPSVNYSGVVAASNSLRYASGGIFQGNASSTASNGSQTDSQQSVDMEVFAELVKMLGMNMSVIRELSAKLDKPITAIAKIGNNEVKQMDLLKAENDSSAAYGTVD